MGLWVLVGILSTRSFGQSGDGVDSKRPRVGYVTNGIASFWVIAEKGALQGGKDFQADVEVRMPPNGVEDQKRMVQVLLAQGIDGIAISPIDSENQFDLLEEIARRTRLITQDSDAPESDRLCYIGMDNYAAGRLCGQLVKEAIPDGGEIMLFVGRLGQANARLRRQGIIDEVLGRSSDPTRYDDPNRGPLSEGKYTVLDTRTDGFDFNKAKSQAQDAISRYPKLRCMVGLFTYNPPLILEAVRDAGKLDQITIIGFDEDESTLDAIEQGEVYGTVVQNPFRYGYESVRILAGLARNDPSVVPKDGFLNIEARQIRKDNAAKFRKELRKLTSDTP